MVQKLLFLLVLTAILTIAGCASKPSDAGAPPGMKATNLTPAQYAAAVASMTARKAGNRPPSQ